jgi:hypothetical protein
MKLILTMELEIKGVTRAKLEEDLWEEFEEEIDGRITDTYSLDGKEVEVNVLRMDPEAAERS